MPDALVGFASGVGVSIVAALGGWVVQNLTERQRRIDATLFEVYMLLLELQGVYFWIASAEVRREESPKEMRNKSHELAWRIADKLRAEDRIPFMEEMMNVLMSDPAFPSAQARHDAMLDLADRIGERVNPRYQKSVKAMTSSNVLAAATKSLGDGNAPGHMWL